MKHKDMRILLDIVDSLIEWIEAVPGNTPLPMMPGLDRDWADQEIARIRKAYDERNTSTIMEFKW